MKGHISKSTAALFAVIALLAGALIVTISTPNRIPSFCGHHSRRQTAEFHSPLLLR